MYELFEPHQLLEKVATRIATQARIQRPPAHPAIPRLIRRNRCVVIGAIWKRC
ncbi:MAG: hypothetical protein R3E89_14810 [Thiolinea sp.]